MNLQIEPEKIKQLIADLEAEANEDKLASYKPYLKQAEFHAAGAKHRERLLMAGNQLGKTLAGAMEPAIHATGRYPSWWQGKRFDKPTISWVAGTTGETVRDTVQRMLIGRPGQEGTSAIPRMRLPNSYPRGGLPTCLTASRFATLRGHLDHRHQELLAWP
jgi:Terminase large subunit, T4likevirus-type, N-terminal